ncbi:MAG: hypothetical protein ACXWM6_07600 [Thermodesulfobacteriota bacterium]
MNQIHLRKISYLVFILIVAFFGARCATDTHKQEPQAKTYPKDYLHPLKEINLEKVYAENRGLRVLEDNATTTHDYYRGGVQEKEEGETLMKAGSWNEARLHLEKSNRFLRIVLKYQPQDDASLNVYGDQVIIFLPNLLIADNDLKLIAVYKNLKNENKAVEVRKEGQLYLAESLKSVKTEWANQIKKGFEN